MKKLFIETTGFTTRVRTLLGEDALATLQNQLMANPDLGKPIPSCSGLRKIRVADPKRQKGKRGGIRVIYLHVQEANWIFLLDAYGKDEKEDLSAKEKKILRNLVQQLKKEAQAASDKTRGEGNE